MKTSWADHIIRFNNNERIGKEWVDRDEILLVKSWLNCTHKSAVGTRAQKKKKINKNILWQSIGLGSLEESIGHFIIICEWCATDPLDQKNLSLYMHLHTFFFFPGKLLVKYLPAPNWMRMSINSCFGDGFILPIPTAKGLKGYYSSQRLNLIRLD